jgi:hypothetical protein
VAPHRTTRAAEGVREMELKLINEECADCQDILKAQAKLTLQQVVEMFAKARKETDGSYYSLSWADRNTIEELREASK